MSPSTSLEEVLDTHSAVVYDTFAVEQASEDVEGESSTHSQPLTLEFNFAIRNDSWDPRLLSSCSSACPGKILAIQSI